MDAVLGLKFVEEAIPAIPGKKVKRKTDTEDSAGIQINGGTVGDLILFHCQWSFYNGINFHFQFYYNVIRQRREVYSV